MDRVGEECKHRETPYNRNPFSQRQLGKTAGPEANFKRTELFRVNQNIAPKT